MPSPGQSNGASALIRETDLFGEPITSPPKGRKKASRKISVNKGNQLRPGFEVPLFGDPQREASLPPAPRLIPEVIKKLPSTNDFFDSLAGVKIGPQLDLQFEPKVQAARTWREFAERHGLQAMLKVHNLWDADTVSDIRKIEKGNAQLEFLARLCQVPRHERSAWLLVAPTNSGKSFVALIASALTLVSEYKPQREVIITPDKDLIDQLQIDTFRILSLEPKQFAWASGAAPRATRARQWKAQEKQLFVYTPAAFLNDVESGVISPSDIGHVMLDEFHHYFDGVPRRPDPDFMPSPRGQIYKRLTEWLVESGLDIIAITGTPGRNADEIDELRRALYRPMARAHKLNVPPHHVSGEVLFYPLDDFKDPRHNRKLVWAGERLLEAGRWNFHRIEHGINYDLGSREPFQPFVERLHRMCRRKLPEVEESLGYLLPEDLERLFYRPCAERFHFASQGESINLCSAMSRVKAEPDEIKAWNRAKLEAWKLEHHRRLHGLVAENGVATYLSNVARSIFEVKFHVQSKPRRRSHGKVRRGPSPTVVQLFDLKHASMGDPESLSHPMRVYRYFACGAPRLDECGLPLKNPDGSPVDPIEKLRYLALLDCDTLDQLQRMFYPSETFESPKDLAERFLYDAQSELVSQGQLWQDHPKMNDMLDILQFYFRIKPKGKVIVRTHSVDHGYFLEAYLAAVLSERCVAPLTTIFVEGQMREKERKRRFQLFHQPSEEAKEGKILIAVKLAGEGRHDPDVDLIINYQPLWNPRTLKQVAGRAGRGYGPRMARGSNPYEWVALGHMITLSCGPGSQDFMRWRSGKMALEKMERVLASYNWDK